MKAPAAPALPEELTAVLRRMRLPYVRAAAPEDAEAAKDVEAARPPTRRLIMSLPSES